MKERDTSSRGVVLILVLGMLSIMSLMALAFSVSMRTERVASDHYVDNIRARHLVYAGLARAMEQINSEMGTNLWNDGALVYPAWGVTNSHTDTNQGSYADAVDLDLLAGKAADFVPLSLWSEACAANSNNPDGHWIRLGYVSRITDVFTNKQGEVKTNVVESVAGRVAYMIINCSGLLDANFVGGATLRQYGTNPNEIALSKLTEIRDEDRFAHDRAETHIRYETLQELSELNDGLSGDASNLFIYSRFPQGYWTNHGSSGGISTGLLCIIGLDRPELEAMESEIKAAFIASVTNLDESQVEILYQNLLEYVDEDFVPKNGVISNAYIEHAPMINEIVVTSWAEPDTGDVYKIECHVDFELWNPFVKGIEYPFRFVYDVKIEEPSSPAGAVPPSISEQAIGGLKPERESFFVTNVVSIGDATASDAFGGSYSFKASVNARVEQEEGSPGEGDPVDGLASPMVFNVNFRIGETNVIAMECLDPRFNWNPDDSAQWRSGEPSLGAKNDWTLQYLDPAGITNDGDTAMYLPTLGNRKLYSVGELGYLVYAPWQTVRLRGEKAHRVLDVFVQSTNEVLRGLINPNTMNTNVLAAAFFGMGVNPAADEFYESLEWSDAVAMAERVINSGPYTNLSDVYRAMTNFSELGFEGNKLRGDAFVRNAAGLFSVRQNLFTIIIEAQAGKGALIPVRPGRQRAVAVVWRDPYTGESCVRSIKWLPD